MRNFFVGCYFDHHFVLHSAAAASAAVSLLKILLGSVLLPLPLLLLEVVDADDLVYPSDEGGDLDVDAGDVLPPAAKAP